MNWSQHNSTIWLGC